MVRPLAVIGSSLAPGLRRATKWRVGIRQTRVVWGSPPGGLGLGLPIAEFFITAHRVIWRVILGIEIAN